MLMKNKSNDSLIIGNWYTQYSVGFWQLVDIKPKYAFDNYNGLKISWKKGDRLGDWAIVKKAFTPKMKKSIRVECVDAAWLKPVSEETMSQINQFFSKYPDYKQRFDAADDLPNPYVANVWLTLTNAEADGIQNNLSLLPERFTGKQFFDIIGLPDHCITKPPATHILNFLGFPWELTESFDQLYYKAVLLKM